MRRDNRAEITHRETAMDGAAIGRAQHCIGNR